MTNTYRYVFVPVFPGILSPPSEEAELEAMTAEEQEGLAVTSGGQWKELTSGPSSPKPEPITAGDALILQDLGHHGDTAGCIPLDDLSEERATPPDVSQGHSSMGSGGSSGGVEVQAVFSGKKDKTLKTKTEKLTRDGSELSKTREQPPVHDSLSDNECGKPSKRDSKERVLRKTKSRGKGKGRLHTSLLNIGEDVGIDNEGFSSTDSDEEAEGGKYVRRECWT